MFAENWFKKGWAVDCGEERLIEIKPKIMAQSGEISEQKNAASELQTKIAAMRKVAAWRVLKGKEIE